MMNLYRNLFKLLMFCLCLAAWPACKSKTNRSQASETCVNCLADMVYHSNFLFPEPQTEFAVRIDEESADLVKMKLYNRRNGQTFGWVAYYPKQRKLTEVSSYLNPKPLKVSRIWLEKYESCRGLLCGDQPKAVPQRLAVNTAP